MYSEYNILSSLMLLQFKWVVIRKQLLKLVDYMIGFIYLICTIWRFDLPGSCLVQVFGKKFVAVALKLCIFSTENNYYSEI